MPAIAAPSASSHNTPKASWRPGPNHSRQTSKLVA